MSVSTTTTEVEYTGTGAAPMPVPFPFFEAGDLEVTVAGVPVAFSMTGNPRTASASVTLVTPLAVADTITIRRAMDMLQPTTFGLQGVFSPKSHEAAFDRQVMLVQEEYRRRVEAVAAEAAARIAGIAAEASARAAADAAIIASGATPANVGVAPVIATGFTGVRTVAEWMQDLQRAMIWGAPALPARKVHLKLWERADNLATGVTTKTRIRVLPFGDSLALTKTPFIMQALCAGLQLPYIVNPSSGFGPSFGPNYFCDGSPEVVAGTFDANAGDGYSFWVTGPLKRLVAGSRVRWTLYGVNLKYTECKIFYVKEPGAKSFQVLEDDVVVATVDANDTTGLGVYTLSHAGSATRKVELVGVSGSVQIIGVIRDDATVHRAEIVTANLGGLALSSAMSSTTARALFLAWVAEVDPDLVTFEMDDNESTFYDDVNRWADCIDGSGITGDTVLIASTPAASGYKSVQRNALYLTALNRGYRFFDCNIVGSYADMVRVGWHGDGVHPASACQAFLGGLLVAQLGIGGSPYRAPIGPLIDRKNVSYLGGGSHFSGSIYDLVVDDVSGGAGYDWAATVERLLRVRTAAGVTLAQFSGNTGVHPNVLPSGFKFDSPAGPRSVELYTAGGMDFLMFKNSGSPSGWQDIFVQGVDFAGVTKANVPAAAGRNGMVVYVADAAREGGGSGCLHFSDGAAWRRVSDNAVMS